MAEEKKRGLPVLDVMGTYFSQQEVKGAEKTEKAIKEFSKDLQKAIKSNGVSIASQTSVLLEIKDVLAKAFDIDEERLDLIKEQMRLDAERRLEESRKKDLGDDNKVKRDPYDMSLLKLLAGAGGLAFGAALVGAIAGLRGWEGKAIKNLRLLATVPEIVLDGMKGLRNSVLRTFGLNPAGIPIRGADGRFTGERIGIRQQILNSMDNLRTRFLNFFGIGADGKPIMTQGADGKFRGPSFMSRVNSSVFRFFDNSVKSITEGFRTLFTSVSEMFKGTGFIAKAATTFKNVITKIPIIGQILGVIFSTIEGAIAAFNAEGGIFTKIHAFISAFISDFFGSFFDLVKDLLSWGLGLLGFERAERFLDSFSIEDELEKFLLKPIDYIKNVFSWMGSMFDSDAERALTSAQANLKKSKDLLVENEEAIQDAMDMGDYDAADNLRKTREALLRNRESREKSVLDAQRALEEEEAKPSFLEKMRTLDVSEFLRNLVAGVLQSIQGEDGYFYSGLRKLMDSVGAYEFARINPETGEAIAPTPQAPITQAVQPIDEFTGAEVDARSREQASVSMSPSVTVTAPQTMVQTDNSVRSNTTTIAPASPRRGRMPLPQGYQDPIYGA